MVNLIKGVSPDISCHVIILNNVIDPDRLGELEKTGAPIRVIKKWKIICGFGLVQTLWWLRREYFDASITFLFYSDIIGTLLSRLAGITEIISSQRSTNKDYSTFKEKLLSVVLYCSSRIILNGEGLLPEVSRYLPRSVNVHVVSTGIKINQDSPVQDCSTGHQMNIKEMLNIPPGAPIVGVVGRVALEKGLDTLVQAISLMKRGDAHFLIIGGGSGEQELGRNIEVLGLKQRVHLLGHRRDVPRILPSLNVFVQASIFEGLPMSLSEAVATERPVVTTAVGGITDLILDNSYGWIVPTGKPETLALAIDHVLCDPIEAKERASRAKTRLCNHFSYERMIKRWKHLIGDQRPKIQDF